MRNWADKYPFQAEVKGGSMSSIRPEKIYITSNYLPSEIWSDPLDTATLEAMHDRFELVDASSWTRKRSNKNAEKWAEFLAK